MCVCVCVCECVCVFQPGDEHPAPQTRNLFIFTCWPVVHWVPLAFSGGLLVPPVLFSPFPPLALLRGLLHLVDLAFSAGRGGGGGLLGAR